MYFFSKKNPYGDIHIKIAVLSVMIIISLTLVPVAVIFALNTLFGFGLAYSLKNVLAVIILMMLFNGGCAAIRGGK